VTIFSQLDSIQGYMVVEKLVEYYLVFLAYYFDETFHYPIGQHLNERDMSRPVDLRTFESI
jgi:hypothetical protein